MATERLQKILARGGIASRRAAERAITDGRVRVNGHVVTELGSKADPVKDRVEIDGERVVAEALVYVILHKPRGVVTTMSDPEGRPSIRDILAPVNAHARVYPVGRLDFATSGVLLVTNDGDFADGLMHPRKAVPKTYVVKVAGVMEPKDLDRWREGIRLEDGVTLPAKLSFLRHEGDKTWFELTIREGRNQQIRRMGEASGFPVMRLARVSFAGISAEGLKPGAWRYLTPDELVTLRKEYGVPKKIVDGEARAMGAMGKRRSNKAEPDRALGPGRGRRPVRRRVDAASNPAPATPRYGGGSPGRRSYEVTEDWGGGAGRGRSGGESGAATGGGGPRRGASDGGRDESMPRRELGGRGGASRTTGTGGGIGAGGGGGDYRVRGRRKGGR